jgi:hypothetical protein
LDVDRVDQQRPAVRVRGDAHVTDIVGSGVDGMINEVAGRKRRFGNAPNGQRHCGQKSKSDRHRIHSQR